MVFDHTTVIFISKGKKGVGYKKSLVCKTQIVKVDRNKNVTLNRCPQGTVHGHKYWSPSISYYIFHIKPHFFKKYFKALSGQIFMKFMSRHAEFFEFYLFI